MVGRTDGWRIGQGKDGWSADEGWLRLECGCVAVDCVHIVVGKWLKRRRASECESIRWKVGEGIPNVGESGRSLSNGRARARANVRGRGSAMECGRGDSEYGRSLSDKMRASPSDVLRVIRGRSNGSGETRATALPKPSAALFAQVLLATNCTPARASLRDSLSLGGYALGFPPLAGVSPSLCAAKVPRPPLAGRWRRGGSG